MHKGAVDMKKNKMKKKLFFWGIIAVIFGTLLIQQQIIISRLNKQYKDYEQQKARVEAEGQQLTGKLKTTQREDYIQDAARQNLGLIKKDEILIKDKNKER
jgi:cell division protein FtsB